jgi:hypothetical protein
LGKSMGKRGRKPTSEEGRQMMGEKRSTRLKAASDDSVSLYSILALAPYGRGTGTCYGSSSYIAMKLSSAPCPFIPPHPRSVPSLPNVFEKRQKTQRQLAPQPRQRRPESLPRSPCRPSRCSYPPFFLFQTRTIHLFLTSFVRSNPFLLKNNKKKKNRPSSNASQSSRKKTVTFAPP